MSDNTYKKYLANKHGSGVLSNVGEDGTHKTVKTVLDAYSVGGQQIPAAMQGQIDELNEITNSERELANATPEARHTLSNGGVYDALAVGRRERELTDSIMNTARGIISEPAALELRRSRAATTVSESNAKVTGELEEGRIAAGKAQNDAAKQQSIAAKITAEAQTLAAKGTLKQAQIMERAQVLATDLEDVSTYDLIAAVEGGDPAMASKVFGEDVDRRTQLAVLSDRLAEDGHQRDPRTGGRKRAADALTGGATQNESLNLGILNFQKQEALRQDFSEDLPAMLDGSKPIPAGFDMADVQHALETQENNQVEANQLTIDSINGRLDIEGAPKGVGKGQKEDKTTTATRLMSIMPAQVVNEIAQEIKAGNPVELPVPNSELVLTVDPRQAATAVAQLEKLRSLEVQAAGKKQLRQDVAQTYNTEVANLTANVKSANFGVIPPSVQQILTKSSEKIGNVAFGEGNPQALQSALGDVETALLNEGMSEDLVESVLRGTFTSTKQVGNLAIDMLSMSPDPTKQSPAMVNFLRQVEARAKDPGMIGSSPENPLTPDRLHELRTMIEDSSIAPHELREGVEDVLGYPLSDLRGMLKNSVVGANFAQGFNTFLNKAVQDGFIGGEDGQEIYQSINNIIKDRLDKGHSLSTEDYIETVQTIASGYVADAEKSNAMMNVFYDALRDVDARSIFMNNDGTISHEEAATLMFVRQLTTNSPVSGKGAPRIQDVGAMLGHEFEQEVDRVVLGQQRMGTDNVSAVVGNMLGGNTQEQILTRGLKVALGQEPNSIRMRDDIAPEVAEAMQSDNADALYALNPPLTKFLTKKIVEGTLGNPIREQSWTEMLLTGGTRENTLREGFTREQLQDALEEARELGILK